MYEYPVTIDMKGRTSKTIEFFDAEGTQICQCSLKGSISLDGVIKFIRGTKVITFHIKGRGLRGYTIFDMAEISLATVKITAGRHYKRKTIIQDNKGKEIARLEPSGAKVPSGISAIFLGPWSLMTRSPDQLSIIMGNQEAFMISGDFPKFSVNIVNGITLSEQAEYIVLIGCFLCIRDFSVA